MINNSYNNRSADFFDLKTGIKMNPVNDFDYYKVFYYVAETGNMGRASELLQVTPSSVTKNIKSLEESLDCQLFIRSTRGVRLTKEGNVLFNRVKPAFKLLQMGEQELKDLRAAETGTLNIGIVTNILPNILTSDWLVLFQEKFPGIRVNTINLGIDDIVRSLNSGDLDLCLISCPKEDNNEPYVNEIDLEELMEIPDIPITGGKYTYLTEHPVTIEELKDIPLLFASELYSNAYKVYEKKFAEHDMDFEPSIRTCAVGMQVNGIRHGLGYTFVPASSIKKPLLVKEVYELKISNFEPYIQSLCVGTSREFPLSNAAMEFIRIMREHPDTLDNIFE